MPIAHLCRKHLCEKHLPFLFGRDIWLLVTGRGHLTRGGFTIRGRGRGRVRIRIQVATSVGAAKSDPEKLRMEGDLQALLRLCKPLPCLPPCTWCNPRSVYLRPQHDVVRLTLCSNATLQPKHAQCHKLSHCFHAVLFTWGQSPHSKHHNQSSVPMLLRVS